MGFKENKKIFVLFTPGFDSMCSFFNIKYFGEHAENYNFIYYDLKTKYSKIEIEHLKKLGEKFYDLKDIIIDDTLNFSAFEKPDAYVPNRNLLLCMYTAGKYGADEIIISGSKSDRVSDNNEKIMDDLSEIISRSLKRAVKIKSYFWLKYKEDMYDITKTSFSQEFSSTAEIASTLFSCYTPELYKRYVPYKNMETGKFSKLETYECLDCKACFRKNVTLFYMGILLPFNNKKIIDEYYEEFSNDTTDFIENRRANMSVRYIRELKEASR